MAALVQTELAQVRNLELASWLAAGWQAILCSSKLAGWLMAAGRWLAGWLDDPIGTIQIQ